MDGEVVPEATAALGVRTDAVLRGASVFEGVRAYRANDGSLQFFRMADHLDRLFDVSMRFLRMRMPYGRGDLVDAARQVLDANRVTTDAYVRIVVYLGEHGLGGAGDAPAGVFILAAEATSPGPALMRVTLSPWRRLADVAMPPRVKSSANYLNSRIATTDAQRKGFDTAILLNERGQVAEGPAMNVFLVRDGELVTPAANQGILEGITRATVIELASDLGIRVSERAVDASELYVAREIFLCGTSYEVRPVKEIDGYHLRSGAEGSLTHQLQDAYHAATHGTGDARDAWLTPGGRAGDRSILDPAR
jgi:branched-chain amino acid aminotransferase